MDNHISKDGPGTIQRMYKDFLKDADIILNNDTRFRDNY